MTPIPVRYGNPNGWQTRAGPGTLNINVNPILYAQLGDLLADQGRLELAADVYGRSTALRPDAAVCKRQGDVLRRLGRFDDAAVALERAVELAPEAHTYNALGLVLMDADRLDEAIEAFQAGLRLAQAHYIHFNLGNAYKRLGERDKAMRAYEAAIAVKPDYERPRFGMLTCQLRIVYESVEEIEQSREGYRRQLAALVERYGKASPQDRARLALSTDMPTPFLLAYQGRSDRDLQRMYGGLVHNLMSAAYPQWTKPRPAPPPSPDGKLRIGLVSSYFYGHTVWKLMLRGWLESLDRSRFEVYGYHLGLQADATTALAERRCDKFEKAGRGLEEWAQRIDRDQLHAIIFPEIGMHALTMMVASLRLAPVQMLCWGHAETTGLPTIDYFLSSDLMEPPDGQNDYTEELVRLPNLGIYYLPIAIQPEPISRSKISVADDEVTYLCCQSLFKYLPQHDDVFPRIAKRLGPAKFLFIREQHSGAATEVFFRRLKRSFESFGLDYRDHCVLLPRLSLPQFLGLGAATDVFLDSIGWSGGNTALETVAFDIPLVTWPGEIMRGRLALGVLRRMGIDETIASSKEEYVDIAVRLGRDPDYRARISERIAANKHLLYRDEAPVRALEDLIHGALASPS